MLFSRSSRKVGSLERALVASGLNAMQELYIKSNTYTRRPRTLFLGALLIMSSSSLIASSRPSANGGEYPTAVKPRLPRRH
jgi:hypothetical protein